MYAGPAHERVLCQSAEILARHAQVDQVGFSVSQEHAFPTLRSQKNQRVREWCHVQRDLMTSGPSPERSRPRLRAMRFSQEP